MTTPLQWYVNYPEQLARLVRSLDFRMGGIALDGVSAEDVVHDVLAYRGDYPLTGNVYNSMYRLALSRLRDVMRHRSCGVVKVEQLERDTVVVSESAEVVALRNVGESHLLKLCGRLTNKQSQVIIMHYYLDMSYDDIALRLGCGVGSVKSLRNRAIERLQELGRLIDADLAENMPMAHDTNSNLTRYY
jgi:RNA polymerase sigma factor (sigma-70 family)